MNNLVVVAIPDENDRVWKVSSDQIPHLTLLFLGEDVNAVSNLEQIMLFVEHAANTTLKRFYLPVDRRGELGNDPDTGPADVLFFKKGRYDFKAVRDFRAVLLQDHNIKTAYDSAQQFDGPWQPHLTLGYPETTPANKMPDDWSPSFYEVSFNKIAIWTGDFEGPEFLLKDYWDDMDAMELPMDVAMSDISHHGVKGQRWGVRKETANGGHIRISEKTNKASLSKNATAAILGPALLMPPLVPVAFLSSRVRSEVKAARAHNKGVKADKKWQKQLSSSKNAAEVHNTAAAEINKKLPDFNNDKRWKGLDLTKNAAKQKEYDDAVERELMNPEYAKAAVKVHGSSPTGRYKFEIHDASRATLKVVDTTKVEHAAGDELSVQFAIQRDGTGHILGFDADEEDTAMAQTVDLGVEFLEHHGVKGMRWGVRKENVASGAKAVGRAAKSTGGAVGKAAGATSRFVRDANFEAKIENGKAREAVIGAANKPFYKEDLPAIKARHGDYGKLRNRAKKPFSKEASAYRKDARETYVKRLESTANSMKNASGTRQYTIRERGIEQPAEGGRLPQSKHFWDISSREVKHAFSDDFTRLELVMDEEGYISELKQVEIEKSMAQTADLGAAFLAHQGIKISASDLGSQFVLEHFGVKGMHWGQRKAPPAAVTPTATSKVPHGAKRKTKIQIEGGENHPAHEDAIKVAEARAKLGKSGSSALSNKELRDVANRLQLEQQVAQLTSSKGRKFVRRQLEQEGQQQFQKGLRKGTKTAGKTAFKLALG